MESTLSYYHSRLSFVDRPPVAAYSASEREGYVKEINDALRRKQAQLELLGKQIAQLQAAAEELRSVAHLLDDSGEESGHSPSR